MADEKLKKQDQINNEYYENNPFDENFIISDTMEKQAIEIIQSRYEKDDETIYFWDIEGRSRTMKLPEKLFFFIGAIAAFIILLIGLASILFALLWIIKLISNTLMAVVSIFIAIMFIFVSISLIRERDSLFEDVSLGYFALFLSSVPILGIISSDTIVDHTNFQGSTGSYFQWMYFFIDIFFSIITGGLFSELIIFSDIEVISGNGRIAKGILKTLITLGALQSVLRYLSITYGFTRKVSPVKEFIEENHETLLKSGITFRRIAEVIPLKTSYRDLGELFCEAIDPKFKDKRGSRFRSKRTKKDMYKYYYTLLSPSSTIITGIDPSNDDRLIQGD